MKKTMKNTVATLRYTPALTRALKGFDRLICQTDDAGAVYVTNGYILAKLNGPEYDELIRPISQRDAGAWSLDRSGNVGPGSMDLQKALADADKKAAYAVTRAPLAFAADAKKKLYLTGYYSAACGFTTCINSAFAEIAADHLPRKSAGALAGVVIYDAEGEPFAYVLPVRPKDNDFPRACAAYFTAGDPQPAAPAPADWETERAALLERMDAAELHARALEAQRDEIQKQLDAAKAAPAPQAIPQEQPAGGDKIAALVDKIAALGLCSTVKGAQTAAPVIWIDGDADAHKADLEQLGAKFAGKRGAWYVKA